MFRRKDTPQADVCLILEGTYPFVTGGVSTWVHELIQGLPELTFAVLHISAFRSQRLPAGYELPQNIVAFLECFAHDAVVYNEPRHRWTPWSARRIWKIMQIFHDSPLKEKKGPFHEMMRAFTITKRRVLNTRDLLLSKRSWRCLQETYQKKNPDGSFIDFFWTWRAVHMPIFQILNIEIPRARVYHIVSTGYAGMAGVVAKIRTARPLLLTEHGIYVKERKIEINRADWIYSEPEKIVTVKTRPGVLKEIWSNAFVTMGKLCYEYCDQIFTLFDGNRQLQMELGAPEEKLEIIPNGVKTDIYGPLRDLKKPDDGLRRVGFVGRVVPIKDVKCFIKACRICADKVPNTKYMILGPIDEDSQYFSECQALVEMLGMTEKIHFYGSVKMQEYYHKLDVFVLTSISEGQPLTILEAGCAGVPTIATDVGSCSELLLGRTAEDRALGPSGIITSIGKPTQTGEAMITLLTDEPLRQRMIRSGFERIDRYYHQDGVIDRYRHVYKRWIEAQDSEIDTPMAIKGKA